MKPLYVGKIVKRVFSSVLLLVLIIIALAPNDSGKPGTAADSFGSVVILGLARNARPHLNDSLLATSMIGARFHACTIIIMENDSQDGTRSALKHWQADTSSHCSRKIILDQDLTKRLPERTHRLAFLRNRGIRAALKTAPNADFIIIADLDNVFQASNLNMSVFEQGMLMSSHWDVLSFNRHHYYDIWALRYKSFDVNVWNFGDLSSNLVKIIKYDITRILHTLAPNSLFPVYSAFNGLSIYKARILRGCPQCKYSGIPRDFPQVLTEDCEHVYFHKNLIKFTHARIRILSSKITLRLDATPIP